MRALYEQPGGRRDLVAALLAERPWCEVQRVGICQGRAVDVHEKRRRSQGGNIMDEAILVCVCRMCHDWIGQHPVEAAEAGWHLRSWEDGV
jgi:hypothetical protein